MEKITFSFSRKDRIRSLLVASALSLGTVSIAFILWLALSISPFRQLDNFILGHMLDIRNRRAPELLARQYDSVIIVKIDDESLKSLKVRWPIPRSLYGDILHKLEDAGAAAVGLDIIFPDPYIVPKEDALFIRALRSLKKSVLAYSMEKGAEGLTTIMPCEGIMHAIEAQKREHAMGFVMEQPDRDGFVRIAPLEISIGGKTLYSFDLLLYSLYLGTTPEIALRTVRVQRGELSIDGESAPILYGYINYTGRGEKKYYHDRNFSQTLGDESDVGDIKSLLSEKMNYLTLADVTGMSAEDLRMQFFCDPETGKAKRVIVLIGATATGTQENKSTPLGVMQGIEVHANIIMCLLDNTFLVSTPPWLWVLLIIASGLFVGGLLPLVSMRVGVVLIVALAAAPVFSAYWLLTAHSIILTDISPQLFNIVLVSAGIYLLQYQKVRKSQSRLSSLIRELAPLPSPMIEEYVRGTGSLDLGGKEHVLTILFCDVRGYTDMSERMEPVNVMDTLNEYYTAMGEIFQKFGGVIFDYIGDAQMVVFGLAGASKENHAVAACRTGIAMNEKMMELQEHWKKMGKNSFEVGIGIATGPVSLGMVGSSHRKQYTAIGNTTNVAARIQGLSAQLNSKVTILDTTYEMCRHCVLVEELKPQKVKGKAEPIKVYKVLAMNEG